MTLPNNISEGITLIAFWIPFSLMSCFCAWLVQRNVKKLKSPQLPSAQQSVIQIQIAMMTVPLLAFSCGLLFFTVKIVFWILRP
jgi:hypothetical protein